MKLEEIVRDKRVLFITTHRIDYIRNTQELEIINKEAKSVKALYGKCNNHFCSAVKIFFSLFFSSLNKYDVVLVSYMCQMVIPFLDWKFKGKVLVVDFFISLFDAMVYDRQIFKEFSWKAKIVHWLDCISLKNAQLVIADTKTHAEYFIEEFQVDSSKIEILYLNADKKIYYPMKVEKPNVLNKKFLVLYFGTVIPLQGFDIVLDAIEYLKDYPDIYFMVIGPVSNLYRKKTTDNVMYIDWLPQEELAQKIGMADLCLAGHFNDKIKKADRTIPGKAYIYEAMNKKMILGDSTANHEIFQSDSMHKFVPMGDAKMLANAIIAEKVCKINE